MDCAPQLPTRETLLSVCKTFLHRLTEVQWLKLESGSVDKTIKQIITDLCVEIINIISGDIYEAVEQRLSDTESPPKSSGRSDGSEKAIIISEQQVRECLGDTISLTLSEAMGVPEEISSQSSEEITKLVAKEVTERVNSQLSKSSGSSEGNDLLYSKPPPRRVKKMVQYVLEMIKKIAAKMTCKKRKGHQKIQKMVAEIMNKKRKLLDY